MVLIRCGANYFLPVLVLVSCIIDLFHGQAVDQASLNSVFWTAIGNHRPSLEKLITSSPDSGLNESCFDPVDSYRELKSCIAAQCVNLEDMARLYNIVSSQQLQPQDVTMVAPGVLYVLTQNDNCSSESTKHGNPSQAAVWGFSFLFVTLINLCSLFGALVLPCMNMKIYRIVLMFMVSLAVGTLVGSGLLVLIPEALELGHGDDLNFLWKTTTVMGGIYLFFVLERIMRIINARRESTKEKRMLDEIATQGTYVSTFHAHAPESPQSTLKNSSNHHQNAFNNPGFVRDNEGKPVDGRSVEETGNDTLGENGGSNDQSNIFQRSGQVAPVAYMVIFGDALHNMIDGLSIGAAFTDTTLLGISVALAVMCEELPHELGDFAILLNSGMSMRKALFYNFLSSLSCYVGLVIGILLGENTTANTWIFAIAGGMFLYISLADMMPEMNTGADTPEGREFGPVRTFLLQNVGLLLGFGIILILAVYGGEIKLE